MQNLILKAIFSLVKSLIGQATKDLILEYISLAEQKLTESYVTGQSKKTWVMDSIKETNIEFNTKFKSFIKSMIVDILVAEFKSDAIK